MPFYQHAIASNAVPWRLRNGIEQWVESTARSRHPALYRWLHFGSAGDPLRPITRGPMHHFFGYYDKSPWNASGCHMLAHEAAFNDRAPSAEDRVRIGIVHLRNSNRFEQLAESRAWNWQQGSMAQWHPADPERLFVYNDRRNDRWVGIVRNVENGEQRVHERPLYALLPDGKTGFSLSFARLALHRPGYGYAGGRDAQSDDPMPETDGIWRVDLGADDAELIVSLAELAALNPKPSMLGAWHYVNHIQPSRSGKRIAFFHIWQCDPANWEVRLYTCRPDGSELTRLLDTGFISHYDWRDDDAILVWANRPGEPARFLLLSCLNGTDTARHRVFGEAALRQDGHCSFSPDGAWVLNDTYPDVYQMRTLMLVRCADEHRFDIARLHSPKAQWWGEIRCDLHPRWSRDGRQVCVDSVHDGTRQMYVVDVEKMVR